MSANSTTTTTTNRTTEHPEPRSRGAYTDLAEWLRARNGYQIWQHRDGAGGIIHCWAWGSSVILIQEFAGPYGLEIYRPVTLSGKLADVYAELEAFRVGEAA